MALPLLGVAVPFIASALGTLATSIIHQLTNRYLLRALAVTAMAGAFWLLFEIQYNIIKTLMTNVIGHVQASQSTMGNFLELGLCLIPSTTPEAITVVFTVALQAVAVKWTRTVLFAKLA